MKVYALFNLKGGVGKTASAVNLGWFAAQDGLRTLVWDLDPQGATSYYFRIKPELAGGRKALAASPRSAELASRIRGTDFEDLDVLPADFSLRKLDLALDAAKKSRKRLGRWLSLLEAAYERVILDCPPSLSVVSENVFEAADALLVPTIPTPLSLRTLEQIDHHLDRRGISRLRLLPFLSMVDRRKQMHRAIGELASLEGFDFRLAEEFLPTRIPYSSLVEQMGVHRMPLGAFAPRREPTLAFESLWRDVEVRVGAPDPE